jgi:hypothetical protein
LYSTLHTTRRPSPCASSASPPTWEPCQSPCDPGADDDDGGGAHCGGAPPPLPCEARTRSSSRASAARSPARRHASGRDRHRCGRLCRRAGRGAHSERGEEGGEVVGGRVLRGARQLSSSTDRVSRTMFHGPCLRPHACLTPYRSPGRT